MSAALPCIRFLILILFWTTINQPEALDISVEKIRNTNPEQLPKHLRSSRALPVPKVYRCGDIGQDKVVNFVNANYPDDDTTIGECKFRLIVPSHDICQIRVDLVDTELNEPIRGECMSQYFVVEGAVWPTGLSPLCGINTDQHFYLHLEPWSGNTSLVDFKVITVVRGRTYRFGVWLTQIDCSAYNVLRAPEGCTQYFLGEKGSIKSFNYEGYRYLNGQSYQICIRPGRGVCGIRYDSAPGDFGVKKSVQGPKEMLVRSGAGTSVCGTDYILIPDGKDTIVTIREGRLLFRRRKPQVNNPAPASASRKPSVRLSQDRFCGGNLSPVGGELTNRPLYARVRSNLITLRVATSPLQEFKGKIEALNLTTGFKLEYVQLRNCEDNQTEMVSQPPIGTLLNTLNPTFGDYAFPLSREPEIGASASDLLSSVTAGSGNSSSLVPDDIQDDDTIWEYLDAATDDEEQDETDLYEYF